MDAAFGVEGSPIRARRTPVKSTGVAEPSAGAAESTRGVTRPEVEVFGLEAQLAALVSSPDPAHVKLSKLEQLHAAQCPHCLTASGHTQLVFGEGSPTADLMFIGEAPGETEDSVGRPFVGRAGQKLDEMIKAMGLAREGVYIANVLKSRPPENRTPLPLEVARCGPTLAGQIAIIKPRCIVTLGGPATKLVLQTEVGITKLRGSWARWAPPAWLVGAEPVDVMPTFHPAYLLRNYTAQTRAEVWSDLKQVMGRIGR